MGRLTRGGYMTEAMFLKERCSVESGAVTTRPELYAAYCEYCVERGEVPISKFVFGRVVIQLVPELFGVLPGTGRGTAHWFGLALKTEGAKTQAKGGPVS